LQGLIPFGVEDVRFETEADTAGPAQKKVLGWRR
jgi:hypothetical protein